MPEQLRGARLGRYTLVRALGAGGMAELFLARADGIGGFSKLVALKRILPHKAKSERFVRMLLNEARLVASLDHPNIAHVYDVDVDQGQYFFAMEYVHGQDLRRIQLTTKGQRLNLDNVLHIAIGICAGLHHAHEARDSSGASLEIVHRDVSPSNVLVSYEGAVKLVDFGVAKAASLVSETREGVIKGKYGYMSPEQCLGDPLDRRSDVFAVGIILWELATGRRLYKINGELATLQRVVYVDAPPPSRYVAGIPPELERIIIRALARDRDVRYQTAQQLQLDLETLAVEHKLSISAVSMSTEMCRLFRGQIDAWREAERAGRSLADHLAEVSSDDSVDSGQEDEALDAILGDMATAVFAPDPTAITKSTAVERIPKAPSSPPHPVTSAPIGASVDVSPSVAALPAPAPAAAAAAPRRGRRHLVALGALLALGGAGAAVYTSSRSSRSSEAHRQVDEPSIREPMLAVAASTADAAVTAELAPNDLVETPEVADAAVAPEPAPDVAESEPRPVAKRGERSRSQRVHHADDEPTRARVEPATAPERDATAEVAAAPNPTPPAEREPDQRVAAPATAPAPGTVDPAQARAVVRAHVAEVQTCVSRARMDNRDLKGRIVMRIELLGTGKVRSASVASSMGAPQSLEACMAKAVASWTFPAPAGGARAVISYPFVF